MTATTANVSSRLFIMLLNYRESELHLRADLDSTRRIDRVGYKPTVRSDSAVRCVDARHLTAVESIVKVHVRSDTKLLSFENSRKPDIEVVPVLPKLDAGFDQWKGLRLIRSWRKMPAQGRRNHRVRRVPGGQNRVTVYDRIRRGDAERQWQRVRPVDLPVHPVRQRLVAKEFFV